jgi:hypothetical protein
LDGLLSAPAAAAARLQGGGKDSKRKREDSGINGGDSSRVSIGSRQAQGPPSQPAAHAPLQAQQQSPAPSREVAGAAWLPAPAVAAVRSAPTQGATLLVMQAPIVPPQSQTWTSSQSWHQQPQPQPVPSLAAVLGHQPHPAQQPLQQQLPLPPAASSLTEQHTQLLQRYQQQQLALEQRRRQYQAQDEQHRQELADGEQKQLQLQQRQSVLLGAVMAGPHGAPTAACSTSTL